MYYVLRVCIMLRNVIDCEINSFCRLFACYVIILHCKLIVWTYSTCYASTHL